MSLVALALAALLSPASVLGSQATPGPVDPAACTIAPRGSADFAQASRLPGGAAAMLRGTPVVTPTPPTGGTSADQETIDKVTETTNLFFACVNAGDFPRVASLMSDDYFPFFFAGIDDANQSAIQATPVPLPLELRAKPPVVEDVRVLPDGKTTALITDSSGGHTLAVFVEVDGQYRLDFSYDRPSTATPTP